MNAEHYITTDLRAKTEAVQILKEQYYIGSSQAFNYLKVCNEYSVLADKVAEVLKEKGIRHRPSIKEVSNICRKAETFSNCMLCYSASIRAVERKRHSKEHKVLPYPKQMRSLPEEDGTPDVLWEFDYFSFLTDYFVNFSACNDHRIAMDLTTQVVAEDKKPYFKDSNENTRSFQEIIQEDSLMVCQDIPLQPDEIDYEQSYVSYLEDLLSDDFEIGLITEEEKRFLLSFDSSDGQGLYERAKKEKKLGYLDIERRIALNEILMADATEEDSVEFIVKNSKQKLFKAVKRLKKFTEAKAPDTILNNQKEYIEKLRYKIRALVSNKKWLQKILAEG